MQQHKGKPKPTIESLRAETGIIKARFAEKANISLATYWRIENKNQQVKPEMVRSCLKVINAELRKNYTLSDIDYYKEDEAEEKS